MSGEKNYRAPPLRKEEIKANLTDFVNKGKVPAPPIFSGLDEDPWLDSILPEIFRVDDEDVEAGDLPVIPQICIPPVKPKKRWRGNKTQEVRHLDPPSPPPTKEPTRQPNHTEMLIEAIFNPFPTSLDTSSPFTYHATYEHVPKLVKNNSSNSTTSEGLGTDGTSRGSFDSSQRISVSGSELGHDAGSSTGVPSVGAQSSGRSWWKRRIGQHSRPNTPHSIS